MVCSGCGGEECDRPGCRGRARAPLQWTPRLRRRAHLSTLSAWLMLRDHVMPNFRIRQSLRVVIQVAGHHGRCSMPLDSGATSSGCRARRGVPGSPISQNARGRRRLGASASTCSPLDEPVRRPRPARAPRSCTVPGEHGAARVRRRLAAARPSRAERSRRPVLTVLTISLAKLHPASFIWVDGSRPGAPELWSQSGFRERIAQPQATGPLKRPET